MEEEEAPKSEYMTRKQVAEYLNVSEKWLASNRGAAPPYYKFGSSVRYKRGDVDNWAKQQKETRRY